MTYPAQAEDKTRIKRVRTEQASSSPCRAAGTRRSPRTARSSPLFPDEADAYNRLGQGAERDRARSRRRARPTRRRSSSSRRTTSPARTSTGSPAPRAKAEPDKAQQVDTSLFIEEMGKTGATTS